MSDAVLPSRAAAGGVVLAERLRVAHTHWARLRGLLGTKSLPPGDGLWLKPCNQIHMIGMRYALDVVFLDDERRVVRTITSLAPGKISPRVVEASSVLELPVGTLARAGLTEGVQIEIEGAGAAAAPATSRIGAWGAFACNLSLAGLYLLFASAHIAFARQAGRWVTVMPLMALESLLVAALFLTRRRSVATSSRRFDWVVGIAGVFLPLLMRPSGPPGFFTRSGELLQIVGLGLTIVSIVFLGRSIGVVAANRGVKTAGTYRVVRHPMYAGYLLVYLGYVASCPSLRNAGITALSFAALIARAIVEERFLTADPRYRDYLRQTRWRFLPYVY